MNRQFLRLFILMALSAPGIGFSRGAKPPPAPVDDSPPDLTPIHLDPNMVKLIVLSRGTDILIQQNDLAQSKLNYSVARSGLYPSLNLSLLAGSIANPSFLIPAVQSLLPFLVPSNWFNAASARRQYQADQEAFRSMQKEILATSLSLYLSILRDQSILNQLERDLEDLRSLEDSIESRYEFGASGEAELSLARSQRLLAAIRVNKTRDFLRNLKIDLKRALEIDPRREVILDPYQWPSDPAERWNYRRIFESYWAKSNPRRQLELLILSAKNQRWARIFGFFGGASITAQTMGTDKFPRLGAKNLQVQGEFNLSYTHIPLVKLATARKEGIALMLRNLEEEASTGVEKFVETFGSVKEREALAEDAQATVTENFENQVQRYNLGAGASFQDVINSRLGIETASLELIEAGRDLDMARVTLARWLETGFFASLPEPPSNPR